MSNQNKTNVINPTNMKYEIVKMSTMENDGTIYFFINKNILEIKNSNFTLHIRFSHCDSLNIIVNNFVSLIYSSIIKGEELTQEIKNETEKLFTILDTGLDSIIPDISNYHHFKFRIRNSDDWKQTELCVIRRETNESREIILRHRTGLKCRASWGNERTNQFYYE